MGNSNANKKMFKRFRPTLINIDTYLTNDLKKIYMDEGTLLTINLYFPLIFFKSKIVKSLIKVIDDTN